MKQLGLVVLCFLTLSSTALAQKCQTWFIKGTYGGLYHGWMSPQPGMPPAPGALLDRITIDRFGNFNANATYVLGGMVLDYAAQGTFDVDEDCTAEATYMYQVNGGEPMGPGKSKCMILNGGDRMECMPLGGVWLGTLERVHTSACSERFMAGRYAASCRNLWLPTGDPDNPLAPAVATAVFDLSRTGSYTSAGTVMVGGTMMEGTYQGEMTVEPDCGLSVEHEFTSATGDLSYSETGNGLIITPGKEFHTISTLQGRVVSCTFRRMRGFRSQD